MASHTRMSSRNREPDVLSSAYLEGTSNKNELLKRLSHIIDALSSLTDEEESSPSSSPHRHSTPRYSHEQRHPQSHHPSGLPSLSAAIVSSKILKHRDPDVRLSAVLVACELLYVYAPDPPWDTRDCITIFTAMTTQLQKLGTTTVVVVVGEGGHTDTTAFDRRYRILEHLSEVKSGVVLVDLIRTERSSSVDNGHHHRQTATPMGGNGGGGGGSGGRKRSLGNSPRKEEEEGTLDALETLCDLIRTLLTCVRPDHPPEVASHAELAIVACLEEFEGCVPYRVLEQLLVCIGRGPIVWTTNPAFAGDGGNISISNSRKDVSVPAAAVLSSSTSSSVPPPARIQVTNVSYLVAARVIRRAEDKVSSPIAALLNGLLAGDPSVVGSTTLSMEDSEAKKFFQPVRGGKEGKKKNKKKKTTTKCDKGDDDDERDVDYEEVGGSPDVSPDRGDHYKQEEDNDNDDEEDDDESGTNVYSVSYELHRIAPQILTTVVGTVSTSLVDTNVSRRWQAVRLLGRLFSARTSDIACRFGPCFREWLRRSYDPEPKIRETMVKCLVNFLSTQHAQSDLCANVNEALATIIQRDPTLDIRLLGIHQVCELALSAVVGGVADIDGKSNGVIGEAANSNNNISSYHKKRSVHPMTVISSNLLLAVGNRVSSKNKKEHKDAITGLAQIYHRHYIRDRLRYVQEGGEDVSTDVILDVFNDRKLNEEEEKFAWIPQSVFECVSYPDNADPEMRNRVLRIVDDVLLGSTKGGGSALTPTSCAVGLAIIVNSVKDKENAYKWMCALFVQRSRLQMALGEYLDARSRAREWDAGSPGAYAANGDAMEKLEIVASLTSPHGGELSNKSRLESILKKFHATKDKHVFRILSTITSPTHSLTSRLRALDELPKRTKGLGGEAQSWVKTLARRCAMGAFLNVESIEHCIILSQECFEAEDCKVSALFLDCIKLAILIFPSIGSTKKGFQNLVEFFDATRTTSTSSSMKRDMEKYEMVTTLSDILARCGTASRPMLASSKTDGVDIDFEDNKSSYDTLREQLLRLCTHDGTPEQARNSVYTISSMMTPQSDAGESMASRAYKEKKAFEPLLKALVNPCRLLIPNMRTNPKMRGRIVSILSAIAAIAECAPYAFNESGEGHKLGWGERALAFALDTVLLGKNAGINVSVEDDENSDSDDDKEKSPAKGVRSTKNNKGGGASEVSVHCQMMNRAIEVLVSHIRSTIVIARCHSSESGVPKLKAPSPNHITAIFTALTKLIEDGVPQSSIIGRYCKSANDQAELRRGAAVNLLRLCDANLQLEAKYLNPRMWHILSSALVDEDKTGNSSVMEELLAMYTSSGKFRPNNSPPMVPSLRFVSLVTLCADGDSAVGKKVKRAVTLLIKQLRATSQVVQAQCCQQGRNAEKNFENRLKLLLMPEYSVPYAIHLLVLRQETASAVGSAREDSSASEGEAAAEEVHVQEASQKMLKQRLKWLFDPLIQSLGSGADNISFLMRMIDLIRNHPPINVVKKASVGMSPLELSLNDDDDDVGFDDAREKELVSRMEIICQLAREVLLSHVKKDVNLTVYPGRIQFPGDLYSRPRPSSTSPVHAYGQKSDEESDESTKKIQKPKKSISHYVKKSQDDDQLDVDDMLDDEGRSPQERLSSETDEHSPSFSQSPQKSMNSSSTKPEKLEISPCVTKSHDKMPQPLTGKFSYKQKVGLSSDSYEHTPPFSPSSDSGGFNNFGDVSPIFHVSSPADVVVKIPNKRPSTQATRRPKSSSGKRKSNAIDVLDEFAGDDSPAYKAAPSAKMLKSTPNVKIGGNSKKSKATPVSFPKNVMVNLTNSTTASSRSSSAKAAPVRKKVALKTKVGKSLDESDDFDFIDSPVKLKSTGHLATKSALGTKKAAPASKAKAPAKSKVVASKKTSPPSGSSDTKSPSASEFSSKASPVYRVGRRGARALRA